MSFEEFLAGLAREKARRERERAKADFEADMSFDDEEEICGTKITAGGNNHDGFLRSPPVQRNNRR